MKDFSLFELPIYRCSPERYNEKMEERKEKDIQRRAAMGLTPMQDYVFDSWRYNEIVGWVMITIWNRRIRGEYWLKERIFKGSKSYKFIHRGKLFSCDFHDEGLTSNDIFTKAKLKLASAFAETFPKRYLDLTSFDSLGPHIDWAAISDESAIKRD